ncbi:hypothetical protein GCM10009104_19360 [Marinobacterium maritimum]|uniref:Uncharacterized protein n=1 Tax=Marinobacterium maritimum TaxID=500162 RepID=A0ABN1I6H0_9GAMM
MNEAGWTEKRLALGKESASAWIANKVSRKADMNRFSADAAACSRFALR